MGDKKQTEKSQRKFESFQEIIEVLIESFAEVYTGKPNAIKKGEALSSIADKMIRIHAITERDQILREQQLRKQMQEKYTQSPGPPKDSGEPSDSNIIVPKMGDNK